MFDSTSLPLLNGIRPMEEGVLQIKVKDGQIVIGIQISSTLHRFSAGWPLKGK